jgi:hypothetical protein
VLEEGVTGNPDGWRPEELRERAWPIVRPHFQSAQDNATARYQQLAGTGRALSDIEAIVTAAYDGRIATLLVAVDQQQWGHFDREARTVELHEAFQPGDDELLDVAAMYTVLKRGTVYADRLDQMPERTHAAAILRY